MFFSLDTFVVAHLTTDGGQFACSWHSVAGHQANLFSDKPGANSVDGSVKYYMGQGVHASKLVIGMPVYGRAFSNTDGIGHPYQGMYTILKSTSELVQRLNCQVWGKGRGNRACGITKLYH